MPDIRLVIQPFGDVDEVVRILLETGTSMLFERVDVEPSLPIPKGSFDKTRGQHKVAQFMKELGLIQADRVLGIVDEDLYTPELNFIFGQADINGKVCVIAIKRLRSGADQRLFLDRVMKEAVHELGHTFGLGHCQDPTCVMHFSNCLEDTDLKSGMPCKDCRKRLKERGWRL